MGTLDKQFIFISITFQIIFIVDLENYNIPNTIAKLGRRSTQFTFMIN
jgi:hypothetical protein